jgi:hypothetical protein
MVLWALAAARASGVEAMTGAEMAELLNAHAPVDDLSASNVSRALRSATLKKQPWLEERKVKGTSHFALGAGWEDAWKEIFAEDPPKIG